MLLQPDAHSIQSKGDKKDEIVTLILLRLAGTLDDQKQGLAEQIEETLSILSQVVQQSRTSDPSQVPAVAIDESDLCLVEACIHAPWTKKQHTEWNQIWPMSFYGGNRERQAALSETQQEISLKYLEMLNDPSVFPQLQVIGADLNLGPEARPGCFGNRQANALLVDPKTDSIVIKDSSHPLFYTGNNSENVHSLDHLCLSIIDNMAKHCLLHQSSNVTDTFPAHTPSTTLNTPHHSKRKTSADQYYCTGLHLYISHEVCVMCAMALVHSRIAMVFYQSEDRHFGALGSLYRVHLHDSLNHHFQVFTRQPHTV